MKKDIHAPGRPVKVMKFRVSQATICKRLRKARGVMINDQ